MGMGLSLLTFENRIEAFRVDKNKDNLNKALNAFCDAIIKGEKIRVLIIKEKLENGEGEDIKVLKLNIAANSFFAFYTSELREIVSPLKYETIVFPLEKLVKLALAEKKLTGIVVNPSEEKDLFIEISMLKKCYEAVQEKEINKNKPENPYKH